MRFKRKGLCLLLALVLAFSAVPLQATAAQPTNSPIGIMPAWANISSISPGVTISNGTASCSSTIIAASGTTSIQGTYQLQRRNANGTWTTERTWSNSTTNSFLTWSGTNAVVAGNTYRLRVEARVTRNGSTETAVVFSAERRA